MAICVFYIAFVIVHLLASDVHLETTDTEVVKSDTPRENRLASLRRVSRQSSKGNGNGLIDEVIPMWKTWLQENGYDPLYIKAYDLPIDNFLAKLTDCDINGLTTFRRTGDVTVNASESAFAAEANVGLDRVSAKCKIQVRWSIFRANGKLDALVEDFSVEAAVIQIRPPPRLTSLRITNQGNIDLEFDGDGIIGSILQWVAQGYLKYKILSFLSDIPRVMNLVNEAISGVDIENAVDLL